MQIEAINNSSGITLQQQSRAVDSINDSRKNLVKGEADLEKSSAGSQGGVQPEEILNRIKALTENGSYSVQFVKNPDSKGMIVKVVDAEGVVIRQIPSEALLGVQSSLSQLTGKIIDTVVR